MRNIYLVFHRDYMGYISAWGFWVSLAAFPLLAFFGAFLGAAAASSAPVRYYAVIEAGDVYATAIEERFVREREALQDGQEALAAAGLPEAEAVSDQVDGILPKFIRVDAPGRTIDELRPWLLGERMVDGPEGEKPLFAAIIVPGNGEAIEYWSENVTVASLRSQLRRASRDIARHDFFRAAEIDPNILAEADASALEVVNQRIRTVEEQAEAGNDVTFADRAPFIMSIIIALTLWTMIFSVIQYLLMGTIEERANKIFDTLLTSVRLPELLAGKLGAVFALTITMMGTWGLMGGGTLLFGAAALPPELMEPIAVGFRAAVQPAILIPALLGMVAGYLIYGVIFIAVGSLCDTIQEAQTLVSPLIMFLMLPMVVITFALQDPNAPFVTAASWVPIFTPFLLILRMPTEPPLWEVIAQISLMLATTAIILWLATKVYRAGAVHGAGISDATAWLKKLIPGRSKKAVDPAE